MPRRYPAVIAYDISKNARRRRVYRVLQDWRLDGQKSVVETKLTHREADELMVQLTHELDLETDRLALVWLTSRSAVKLAGCAGSNQSSGYHG